FFNWLAGPKAPGWVADAKSRPLLESIGAKLESLLPEDPENAILNRLNPNQPAPETGTETPPAADAPAADAPATGDDAPAPDGSETDAPPADN
ncbi:MAG: CvpA family protein, partial [Mesorhizobium sp.]